MCPSGSDPPPPPNPQVQEYAKVFWSRGERAFSSAEWDKIVKTVEKGEKKLEEIGRMTKATQVQHTYNNQLMLLLMCGLPPHHL